MSFCLYISARVFVQYLKSRPDDSTVQSSLQFVVGALNAMKSKNPLTESFLVQLDVDLEGTGIRAVNPRFAESAKHAAQIMVSLLGVSIQSLKTDIVPFSNLFVVTVRALSLAHSSRTSPHNLIFSRRDRIPPPARILHIMA